MKTNKYAILGMVLCTIVTAIGQIFLKLASNHFELTIKGMLTNYYLIIALTFYGLGLLIMTLSFKHGEISILYPMLSLSFVWVLGLSIIFLSEKINFYKVSAIVLIIIGIILISKGREK